MLVKFGKTEHGCSGEEQQHRVQQDKSADRRVRIFYNVNFHKI